MFLIRDYSELSRPETAGKIIKARDFWAFKDAERALADALSKRQQILSSAQAVYQTERRRGYAEGTEEAKREQSGSMVEIVSQTAQYFGKVESRMVDLVLDAVRKVVNDFDDRQRVTTVVKNCLDLVRSQKQLSLNVHPSQVEFLRGEVVALQRIYPSITHIEVHPDPRLALDACVVESDIGIVEASLEGQVQALRDALSVVFTQQAAAADDDLPLPVPAASGESDDESGGDGALADESFEDEDDEDDGDEDDDEDDAYGDEDGEPEDEGRRA